MENVDKLKYEKVVLRWYEFISIIIIFSFLFYILFPSKDIIISNAINENRNIALTEIYLKNIIKIYKEEKFILALVDIYLKQNKFSEAKEVLDEAAVFESFNLRLYKTRIKLLFQVLNDEDLSDILSFYSNTFIWENIYYEKYIDEFIERMIFLKHEKELKDILISILDKNISYNAKKLVFLKYLNVLTRYNDFKSDLKYVERYSHTFIRDNEASSAIIRFYLQINRPDLARRYAIIILKNKNIL